ncbi:Integral membrane protein OS=Tsukamurella paurometabola (strain ATCC 8368 / DSM / CCUG 35730/ CIP 100753 / JCM 10117 / KCTC 9821 / NBRC 16120 / NCIMB 702349/ NCTC 13040) OX=521096 GN=Tpau_3680 PE=4 SV=1 [Tsukamurella paurometabola]|uniref:Integral membrane protein n=1 Tax=Tsukamurella paurometabola (strain ATCC 8368 / DSM 20162 / CCUG 35730 / CIP 100753 / JCM 10117 / KCTC 9821 / NBRC 16120 / NCIMB 702349 / NCTC 13040) TaxID=521096 RepID=D5UY21_TSUPD|nr:hypothetical protein [Tsukamurella paurometabola]ADG80258.1 conserved hypothetical protein [Tsukamurella paurometabola DSM 20162]SUP39038.1 Uncharacterised protein [Tsukamurella paurometabola]
MRSFTAFLLVLVAILATFVAVPANWAKREVLDRDRFTALMEPLGRDRAVQDAMAQEISEQVQRLLTEQGDARPPLDSITPYVTAYTRSPQFPGAFTQAVGQVHSWLLVEPTADQRMSGATTAEIDLAPMIRDVAAANGVKVAVPEKVTIDLSGTGANRDLFRAGRYASVADTVRQAAWIAPLIAVVAGLLALLAAHRRGFLIFYLGLGIAVAAGVTWLLGVAAPSYLSGQSGAGALSPAVFDAAIAQIDRSMRPWILTEAAVGGALAAVGLVFGGLGAIADRRAARRDW